MEEAPKKFFRLTPGREVRLRFAYFLKCEKVIKDPKTGEIQELRCTYDRKTKGGKAPDGRKVKATIHWVSAKHAVNAEVRVYDQLFSMEDPLDVEKGQEFVVNLNPKSYEDLKNCKLEPSLKDSKVGDYFQFERLGYFCVDNKDSDKNNLVFNRTVTLKDTWGKIQKTAPVKK